MSSLSKASRRSTRQNRPNPGLYSFCVSTESNSSTQRERPTAHIGGNLIMPVLRMRG
jgi:hypothetical protein